MSAMLSSAPAVLARSARKIRFHANNRLDVSGLHLLVKGNRAVNIAVIGDGARLHAIGVQVFRQRADLNRAVKQAVIGV